jgi:hypothetical protein
MAGKARENVKDKGFWDGGAKGHGTNKESGGRPSSFPGMRTPQKPGLKTDLEFPHSNPAEERNR